MPASSAHTEPSLLISTHSSLPILSLTYVHTHAPVPRHWPLGHQLCQLTPNFSAAMGNQVAIGNREEGYRLVSRKNAQTRRVGTTLIAICNTCVATDYRLNNGNGL